MRRPSAATVDEVFRHLGRHRSSYLRLLQEVNGELATFRKSEPGAVIKDAYSRASRQVGDEFKAPQKIAAKLEMLREDEPKTQPADVHDIVGVTVVCRYPSEMEVIKAFVRRLADQKKIEITYSKPRSDYGYHAFHLVVRHYRHADLLCEIQIKTMLHEAWAIKMHDLTYKPVGELDARLKTIMESFGDSVQSLELQSDLVRSLVEERWHLDQERKRAARYQLLRTLVGYELPPANGSGPAVDPRLQGLKDCILNDADRLAEAPLGEAALQDVLREFRELWDAGQRRVLLCHLILVLAGARRDGELNYEAVRYLDRWFATQSEEEKAQDLLFKSFALYSLGETWDAIEDARQALAHMRVLDAAIQPLRLNHKSNLASYIADLPVIDADAYSSLKKEALSMAAEAQAELLGWIRRSLGEQRGTERRRLTDALRRLSASLAADVPDAATLAKATEVLSGPLPGIRGLLAAILDTKGAVAITFGTTESQIKTGLLWCAAAVRQQLDAAPYAEVFYDLHERRAWRRLVAL